LEHLEYKVDRVLNFTDVEDKAVEEAQAKGEDIKSLTSKFAEKFNEDINLLRIKLPTHNPRSSTTVDQAVKLIKELLKKDIAYWYHGDVYYDPLKFNGFGKLYGLDMSLWPRKKKHFKKDTYPGMRWNLGDFILWHGCREGENICFDDQLGSGRPSWNVQDPAIATKYLGFQIDICCGGIDNLYRHHDYNIAVVEGVSGETFANYWLHSAHLFAYGKKMSKSVGNIIYLDDILKDGFKPEHVRFFMIYHKHYREKMNFTRQQFENAAERLDKFNEQVQKNIDPNTCSNKPQVEPHVKELIFGLVHSFEECMNNDLDVRCAFDDLYETLKKLLMYKKDGKIGKKDCKALEKGLKEIDVVLQIIYK
jgi:cysteinyl-tRNA synthetase